MKTILTTLFFTISAFAVLQGQFVISEIMYNPPEAGQDSLEYIELYNNSDTAVDLNGYYFSDGVEHAFTEQTIVQPREYYVIAKSSSAMQVVFAVDVDEWESGALKNKGEPIVLNNVNGDIVAAVEYSNAGEWPKEADGGGPSLEICNINGDQADPQNWNVSNTATGVIINGKEVYGSPTKTNSSVCDVSGDYTVIFKDGGFIPQDITIGVGQTVLWNMLTGTHNINGSLDTFPDNPEGFYSGDPEPAPWIYTYTFNVTGKYNYQSDATTPPIHGTVTVIDDLYPFYLIREVISVGDDGVADSLGVKCTLTGIVGSPSFRSNGLTFIMQEDEKNGITVFSDKSMNYEPKPGDEIVVKGVITQFNGLTEIDADSVFLISQGNDIYGPTIADSLGEDNENTLVQLQNVHILDSDQWLMSGSFNIDISNGMDTFTMRIYEGMGFSGLRAPEEKFNATGAVGQFDASKPYLQGYQLIPRGPEDIDPYIVSGNNYPQYEIADVIQNDADGVPDSLGVLCTLEGIVIRGNFRSNGYQFVMTNPDNSAGITVFSTQDIDGYRPESGDIIEVKGEIAFFNGLTEIDVDSLRLLSSGNDIPDPIVVEELSEETENRYITMAAVKLDNLDTWPGNGSSQNIDIISVFSGDKYVMRIDQNVALAQIPIDPVEKGWDAFITITGVGTQFDNSAPYDQGYQVMPFDESDISTTIVSVGYAEHIVDIAAYPNPTSSFLNIKTDLKIKRIAFYDLSGRKYSEKAFNADRGGVNIADFPTGTYLAVIHTDGGIGIIKVLKE